MGFDGVSGTTRFKQRAPQSLALWERLNPIFVTFLNELSILCDAEKLFEGF